MYFRWNESHATGIEEIDALQLELIRRATQLVAAARDRQAPEARAHVARLGEVAEVLFATEEQVLRDAQAPGLERHAHEHRRFLNDLSEVGEALARTGPSALADLQVASYVARWLEAHVGRTDRDLDRIVRPASA